MMNQIDVTNQIDISNVTIASDDGDHIFQYNLNDAKTKKKLYDGDRRDPYEREAKKGSTNLIFNDASFNEVVLKAISELKNSPKHFTVGNERVERITIDPRMELSGKHIDTKVEFRVNGEKLVIHIYNSRQKLMVQGRRHDWFVDMYLEPFFKLRIAKSMPKIELMNKTILSALSLKQNRRTKTNDKDIISEEADILICDKCDFHSEVANELRKHIIDEHTVNVFQGLLIEAINNPREIESHVQTTEINNEPQENESGNLTNTNTFNCDKCDNIFISKDELERHTDLHLYGDNLSLAFHRCRVCEKVVSKKELNIQCSKCIYFFHKKCTDKKDARRNWKTPLWTCNICKIPEILSISAPIDVPENLDERLNPEAEAFDPPLQKSQNLPQLSGKHRKSKVNQENPESEFLKATVDTLKATIAKNGLEIKKLKESNDIKAKRIINLETQVQEARNTITLHQCNNFSYSSEETISKNQTGCNGSIDNFQYVKIANLENRSNSMEQTITLLTSRLESLQFSFLSASRVTENTSNDSVRSAEVKNVYLCDICDHETDDKVCHKTHKRTHNERVLNNKDDKEKISKESDCTKCSYKAIHMKDLSRHESQMHSTVDNSEVHSCNSCEYSTKYEDRLKKHTISKHTQKARYFVSSSKAKATKLNGNISSIPKQSYSNDDLTCGRCDFRTKIIEELRTHKTIHMKSNVASEHKHPFAKDSRKQKTSQIQWKSG